MARILGKIGGHSSLILQLRSNILIESFYDPSHIQEPYILDTDLQEFVYIGHK